MKVTAFNGSPRKDGNCFRLITRVFEVLKAEGIETELVQVGGQAIRGCTACYQCFEKKNGRCVMDGDIVNACIAKMRESDGIILASPDVRRCLRKLVEGAFPEVAVLTYTELVPELQVRPLGKISTAQALAA